MKTSYILRIWCFYLFVIMITRSINKLKYEDLINGFKKDKSLINNTICELRTKNTIILGNAKPELIREKLIKSRNNYEYIVKLMKNDEMSYGTIAVYSIYKDYIVIWPVNFLYTHSNTPYIILVKTHAIDRYIERFLGDVTWGAGFAEFIQTFCLQKNPVLIKNSESEKVDSLMCRVKSGALLGYSYKVCPKILRFNTFVSDKELEEANRKDQMNVRISSKAWKRVQ